MDRVVRIGIIGCGGIANGKHMPSLKKVPNAEMVAFCDIVEERAQKAAKEFGSKDAKVYNDYKELLKDKTIEVIHVLTPNIGHSFITIDALEAGKHVMCEKPMAKTYKEALAMCEAAKRTGKKLTIGYQTRHQTDSGYAKTICDAGELGEIYYAEAHAIRRRAVPTWGVFTDKEKQGGGPLIDIATHALDVTLWLMNNYKPKMVVGKAFYKLGKQTETGNAWGDWDPDTFDVEDSAFGFVIMEDGAVVSIKSSWALNTTEVRETKCMLCGTKAGLDTLHDELKINRVAHNKMVTEVVDMAGSGVAFNDAAGELNSVETEAFRWIDCIVNNKEPIVKPEQALVVTQILEAIYESSETGKPVYLS